MVEDLVDWSIDNHNIIAGAAIGINGGISFYFQDKSDRIDTEDLSLETQTVVGGLIQGTILESGYSFVLGDQDYDPEVAASAAVTATAVYRTLSELDERYLADGKESARELEKELNQDDRYQENPEELFNF
ncbi:hypothetical protein [Candidatus Nanohalobium constans]|uniref:Uncharacterized protein n=1 Tax=Candidatus Nanohalobium constans TaxID=2565781 RepID=A0A5Q0UGH5_9ARCH|nr:hypothetical protein [Candidatus Nanohalobium constans]QGA80742.1 hypothetical protein LC1Nh_0858 [Candidatus Nanohalobium constans]